MSLSYKKVLTFKGVSHREPGLLHTSVLPHCSLWALQVQWNEPGAHYSLTTKETLPRFPFSIDQEGNIYVTQPLDREEKDLVSKTGRISQAARQRSIMYLMLRTKSILLFKKICVPDPTILSDLKDSII